MRSEKLNLQRLSSLIKEGMKREKLNGPQLAAKMGVTAQAIYEWRRGDKQPTAKNLALLAQHLHFETDDVLLEDDATSTNHHDLKALGLVRIPHLAIEASAGDGRVVHFEEEEGETILPMWYARQRFGVSPSRIKRITVVGNSMEPTVNPGEKVYVILLEPGEQLLHGSIYLLRGPHGLQFKRIFFDAETLEGKPIYTVRLHSDNPLAGESILPIDVFNQDYTPLAIFRLTERNL